VVRLSALRTGRLYPQEILLVLISVLSQPQNHSAAGRIVNEKFQWHHRESNPRLLRLVAQCLNQLHHRVPPYNTAGNLTLQVFFCIKKGNNLNCTVLSERSWGLKGLCGRPVYWPRIYTLRLWPWQRGFGRWVLCHSLALRRIQTGLVKHVQYVFVTL